MFFAKASAGSCEAKPLFPQLPLKDMTSIDRDA